MNSKKKISQLSNWFLTKPKISGLLAFVLMLLVVVFVVSLRYRVIKENEHREMSNILGMVHHNFQQVLKNTYITTLSLAMTINDDGVPENFDAIGSKLVSSNNFIDAVQLVPGGIIKYIYPLKGNEAALNYDILNSVSHQKEAQKSIDTKLIYFAGPLQLKQGGIGVIGRLPIFKDGKFWGFSAVMIKFETLLKITGIQSINSSKYYFQFSKINPSTNKEEFFMPDKKDFSKKYFQSVTIPDGNWKLYLITSRTNEILKQTLTSIILGFLLAVICGLWVMSIMKKPAQMQKLIHNQAIKLLNNEIEFQALFDRAPVGIAKANVYTGNYIKANDQYSKLLGYTEEELKNTNFKAITHPDDLAEDVKNLKKLSEGEISEYSMEKRYIAKSGEIIWVNLQVAPLWEKGEKPVNHIATVEDITEKKRAVEELKKSFDLVSEQNKRLLNFSYIVSHNLRSHTSNIQTISTFLETAESQEERDEMIELLKKVSHSLNETMSNLNEVVNIRTNINLTVEKLHLKNNIDNTIVILNDQIVKKQAEINISVAENVTINYNSAYLESILYNLISNAIRYSHPDRNPVINISFDENKNVLKVSDNGIGIDLKKNGDKLFGMYKTFNNNPNSKGIGLFITKNQIDAMGGTITVESKLDSGTTFSIFFK